MATTFVETLPGRKRVSLADVIVLGHTHVPALRSFGSQLIVNPGSLGAAVAPPPIEPVAPPAVAPGATKTVKLIRRPMSAIVTVAGRAIDAVLAGPEHPLSYPGAGLPSTVSKSVLESTSHTLAVESSLPLTILRESGENARSV